MAIIKNAEERRVRRARRHRRVRKKIAGHPGRPRLVVFRSLKHIQGHLVDDVSGKVLVGVSTQAPELKALRENPETTKTDLSREAGKLLAERAKAIGVQRVVLDRGGYLYHGRVAAFAEGARAGGLEF